MTAMFEIVIIALLILANGFFSCAEIAVIAARKSNIKALSEKGNKNAALLGQIQNAPEPFLSTVQIGVTLFGSAAAAVAGVSVTDRVRPFVQDIPYLGAMSQFVEVAAVSIVILAISYLTLVIGELVPKALALKYPEPIALVAARPFHLLAQTLSPFVNLLTYSVRFVLKPFGGNIAPSSIASEEEIKWLLKEGREKGVFNQTEQELIQSVFEFTDISVKEAMVPRPKIHAIQVDTPKSEVIRYFKETKFSRCPVYKSNPNDIIGILLFKDLLGVITEERPFKIDDLLKPVYFVPETMQVSHLLKELQRRRTQMAIVVNEHGSVEGLVTMEDLVEEIVGEIEDETDIGEKPVIRLKDGSWVIDASLPVRELKSDYGLSVPESPDYETIGGFVLAQLQAIPKAGEIIHHEEYKLTVVDMDGRRINKVKIEKKVEPIPQVTV
ncbi:MAG: HlyC/CorC family transporter [Nitrospirae bacterium]|nr:HlyC/CorC family transporter [Candidatus Troglogloeales bacterium]